MTTHLHVHTDASRDGLSPVSALLDTAAMHGIKNIAMTDHGTLGNAVSFTIEANLRGIKPIMGLEAYVEFEGHVGHMTLLANGKSGFETLVRLNNKAHQSLHKMPAISIDDLLADNKDIVVLTGCVNSPLNALSRKRGVELLAKLKGVLKDRLFCEVMFVSDAPTHDNIIAIAQQTGTPIVLTGDVHFPKAADADVHTAMTAIRTGFGYNSHQLYLKTRAEMISAGSRFYDPELVTEWMENTEQLGEALAPVDFKREPTLPRVPKANEHLREKVFMALKQLGLDGDSRYVERAEYELSVVKTMGYSAYFLILDDIVSNAKKLGVRVGPGRGSGAGSLLLFCLEITQIDPIVHELPFERFLNPERIGMPDVDVDFDAEHRHLVLEYAKKKWKASPISTYARYSHKILVHDLAKYFRLDRELEAKAADEGPESDAFDELCEVSPEFGYAYSVMRDQIRHKGTHAGGVIVTDVNVPIERAGDGLSASWTEGMHNELSYAGVVKFDLLGLAALSILKRLEDRFGRRAEPPSDGSPVFEVFTQGRLEGIFQFSGSPGIKALTVRLAPERFADLVAINALYRPGALDVGATEMYPEWKKSPRAVHPLLVDILAPTYGAIVFQEQVMAIFAKITGGTLGAADQARRVIVKSKETDPEWVKKFEALRDLFLDGCRAHKMPEKEASALWHELAAHSRYSFNKAHSVSYAMIAWEMAWWKYFYPAYFYAEMMNVDSAMAQAYLFSTVSDGIEVMPPHVNVSGSEYTVKDGIIFMPLSAVKYMSPASAEIVVSERKINGPFVSFKDFMSRVEKKVIRGQARAGLFRLGALDGLEGSPDELKIKEVETMTKRETQLAYLGVVFPTPKIMKAIAGASADGFISGIVVDIEDKTSPRYGPYKVFRLVPMASFWSRGLAAADRLKKGDCVAIVTKKDSGKAIKAYLMKE